MQIDKKLDALKKIKQVDAPPFLITRIKQQIENLENAPAPVKWKWAFAVSTMLILVLNVSVFFKNNNTKEKAGIESVISAMHLSDTNALYYE